MAKLYFRYGAMNSGKTALLLQAANNYEQQGMKVLVAKPSKDTKGDQNIVSRIGLERKIDFLIKPTDNVVDIKGNIECRAHRDRNAQLNYRHHGAKKDVQNVFNIHIIKFLCC